MPKKPAKKPAHIQELEYLNMCIIKIRRDVNNDLNEMQARIGALIPEKYKYRKRPLKEIFKELDKINANTG